MKTPVLWSLLTVLCLGSCGDSTSPKPADDLPTLDTTDVPDLAPPPVDVPVEDVQETPPAMRPIPMKEVGNPTHIGTKPIRFTDVTDEVGLPDLLGEAVAFVDLVDPVASCLGMEGRVREKFTRLTETFLVRSVFVSLI